jgi:peptidoglycan/LPS O-acetylase OafA/YrhL
MGGFLPFGAGLLYARYGRELAYPTYWAVLVLSAALIFAFGYDYQLWFWIPLFVCTFCIALVKVIPQTRLSLLEWMGGLSAALFVCHPITRKIFIPISRQGDIYTGILLYIIASIAIAWLFKELFKLIPNPKLINN